MSRPNVKVFESKNGQISYYDEGEGYPILFGHSFLWNKDMWRPVIDQLSSSFRCIVPDVFGHGDSSANDQATFEMIVDTFSELMKSLGFEKYAIAGLSIGGMWGSIFANKYSAEVSHLAIINSSLTPEPEEKAALYNQLLDVLVVTQSIPEAVVEKIGPGFFGAYVEEDSKQAFYQNLRSTPSKNINTIVSIGRCFVNRGSLLDLLKGYEGKVCAIAGTQDYYRSVEESRDISDELDATLYTVDAGHISSIEQPIELANKIKVFLR
ncbi:MAG: alpha/beta hydrolase [Lentisphaeraceae bacterium]|nr:alpha/beta hydrolase [Lentisphaeraceae bacterium]